jgi:hypothetical protein
MKTGWFQVVKRAFGTEAPMHPIERGMARHWIKRRLIVVFPELRNNPQALEKAYQSLNLTPRPGQEEGEAETVFEITAPELR